MTITVHSTTMFNSPNTLRWALSMGRLPGHRDWAIHFIASMIEQSGLLYGQVRNVAIGILDGTIPVEYDDQAGTFTFVAHELEV